MGKRKRFKKRKLGPAYFQILFVIILLIIVHLKLQGVSNVDELKSYVAKNKILSLIFGVENKDVLLEAEKKGEGVLQKLNQLEQAKKDITELGNEFASFFNKKNWDSLYDIILIPGVTRSEFSEAQELKEINWHDAELKEQIRESLIKLGGLTLKKIRVLENNEAIIIFDQKKVMVKEALPKFDEIPEAAKLDSHELEYKTGEILLERLKNKEVKIKKVETSLKVRKGQDGWRIIFDNDLL